MVSDDGLIGECRRPTGAAYAPGEFGVFAEGSPGEQRAKVRVKAPDLLQSRSPVGDVAALVETILGCNIDRAVVGTDVAVGNSPALHQPHAGIRERRSQGAEPARLHDAV